MNPEIESTHPKITQSGTKTLVQGIFRFHNTQQPGKNTRDVEHDAELADTAALDPWSGHTVVVPAQRTHSGVNGLTFPDGRRAA